MGTGYVEYSDTLLAKEIVSRLLKANIAVDEARSVVFEDNLNCKGMKVSRVSIYLSFPADASYTNVQVLTKAVGEIVTALDDISIDAPEVIVALEMPTIIDGEILELRVIYVDYVQAKELYRTGVRGSELAKAADGIHISPYSCMIDEIEGNCPITIPTPFQWDEF